MLIKNGKVFLRDGKFHDCTLSFGKTVEGVGEFEGEGLDASGCYVVPASSTSTPTGRWAATFRTATRRPWP